MRCIMNYKEWCIKCESDYSSVIHKWDWKCRSIQQSLKYNPDPNATVRHHLRDTEEQRKYNDEHYELWGFEIDENGNEHFEYGKYIIFMTVEEHNKLHAGSDETNKKKGEASKLAWQDEHYRNTHIEATKRAWLREDYRSCHIKHGEDHPFYGKHHSEETCEKISKTLEEHWSDEEHRRQQSERCTGRKQSEETISKRVAKLKGHETSQETRDKISTANSGRKFTEEHREKLCIARRKRVISEDTKLKTSESMKNVMSSEEHRKRISEKIKMQKHAKKLLYNEYRSLGGLLMWNDFQSFLKHNFERNYVPTLAQLQEALSDGSDDNSDE